MSQFFIVNQDIIIKLAVAMVLGMIIGAERLLVHKDAGMKTHALVAVGASLFVIIGINASQKFLGNSGFDLLRIASQVIVGIGFLGAGLIIVHDSKLVGVTTASGIWVSAGIGMATGFGLLSLAIIATVFTLFILMVTNFIEKPIRKISENIDSTKI